LDVLIILQGNILSTNNSNISIPNLENRHSFQCDVSLCVNWAGCSLHQTFSRPIQDERIADFNVVRAKLCRIGKKKFGAHSVDVSNIRNGKHYLFNSIVTNSNHRLKMMDKGHSFQCDMFKGCLVTRQGVQFIKPYLVI